MLAITGAGCAQHAASVAHTPVLDDGARAVPARVENVHRTRFIEIFLADRDPESSLVAAACYNSMFTSKGIPPSRDTAPAALVEGLDFQRIRQEYGVLNASLNGPKLWLPDWTDIEVGAERNFNGIAAAWVATLQMGEEAGFVEKTAPYQPQSIARKSSLGWNKGTTVVLLDDANGNTWIMKGFQIGQTPRLGYDEFISTLDQQYKALPSGWGNLRLKTLDQDLVETPEAGVATIMADEHFNVWDKTGPGMTNYVP
jgi:hypothetical protein